MYEEGTEITEYYDGVEVQEGFAPEPMDIDIEYQYPVVYDETQDMEVDEELIYVPESMEEVHELELLAGEGSNNIVFIEDTLYLSSAMQFNQFIYRGTRLVTMIGEMHGVRWNCQDPSKTISVAEYIKEAVEENDNCYVLLEYYRDFKGNQMESVNFAETYNALESINQEHKIIPYDLRMYFLGYDKYDDIFGNVKGLSKYTKQEIDHYFIQVYFTKITQDPELVKVMSLRDVGDKFPNIVRNYLLLQYLPYVDKEFYSIRNQLNTLTYPQIEDKLRYAWLNVTDFFALTFLLRDDIIERSEFILVQGQKHQENINYILNLFTHFLPTLTGRPNNCINLYRTRMISNT